MSKYYTPQRSRNIFDPNAKEPFKLSRSRVDLFLNCPRCFYLDRRLGVDRPPGYPFNLNSAVDKLLKKEFDIHRAEISAHPLMKKFKINAVPFAHEKIDEWRDSMHKGITFLHEPTNLLLTGGVDDIWIKPNRELIVVDYKATSKSEPVSLDADWQIGYKRQMEFYQWLLRKNGFPVSNTGYFVYCNGDGDKAAFNEKLHFDITILPYNGNDTWIEPSLFELKKCLMNTVPPKSAEACDYCRYREAATDAEKKAVHKASTVQSLF